MHIDVLPAYMPYISCAVPTETRKGHWIPRTRIADGCEPLGGCWESNPGPLEEQLQPHNHCSFCHLKFFCALMILDRDQNKT